MGPPHYPRGFLASAVAGFAHEFELKALENRVVARDLTVRLERLTVEGRPHPAAVLRRGRYHTDPGRFPRGPRDEGVGQQIDPP